MKVRKIEIQGFKRFKHEIIDFVDPTTDEVRDMVVLVGDNGSGKTSVLQAIALPLALATGRIKSVDEFRWPGFVRQRYSAAWEQPCRITLEIEFDEDELKATRYFAEKLPKLTALPDYVQPGMSPRVLLVFETDSIISPASNDPARYQFYGRINLARLKNRRVVSADEFARVGSVYWYHQERRASSLLGEETMESLQGSRLRGQDDEATLDAVRSRMAAFLNFHRKPASSESVNEEKRRTDQIDYWALFDEAYRRVFPNRRLLDTEPRTDEPLGTGKDNWLLFHDGEHPYELAEMSSGEKAVFPLIWDFVYWKIHRSVILLDEIELHLHPPLQQYLVNALPKLGRENQFILTTHSDAFLRVVPPDAVYRLETR